MAGLAGSFTRRRVLAPDLIGHGLSASPGDVRLYSMAACLAQLEAALEGLGVDRCDLVGYSMGARVALSLTVSRPQFVRNLALIGGPPGLTDEPQRSARRESDTELANFIATNGVEAFVDRWMALPLFNSQERLGEKALANARTQRLANDPVGLANSLKGMGTGSMPPLFADLADVAQPTWWIHGEEDSKFAAFAQAAATAMPHGQVASIATAGHAAHLENLDAVTAVLTIAFNPPSFPD